MKLSIKNLLATALLASSATANESGCVSTFESGVDYFPDKVQIEKSTQWTITYEDSYKVVKNTAADASYLLYQCGTDLPAQDILDQHDVVIPVPLTNVGLHYTTFIPFVELLGQRTNIKAANGQASWIYSPCLKGMASEELVTMISSITNATMVEESGVDKALPFFVGQGTTTPFSNQFEVSEYTETNLLAVFEWLKFFAVFFNAEKEANDIYAETASRVDCAKTNADLVAVDDVKPVVLWASYSSWCGGWDVARSCPNYYCELAQTCESTLLTSLEGSVDAMAKCYRNYMTTEEFVAFGKDADIWIYSGGSYGDEVDNILAKYSEEVKDFKSVKNNKVYDVTGQTMDAWFAERIVEPDTLVQDFCSVVGRENPLTPVPHQLTFLRHIDDAIASPAVCTDRNAPMLKMGSECVRVVVPETDDKPETDDGVEEEPNAASAKSLLAVYMLIGAAAVILI